MSASPSCQCIASAARHGTAISSATLDHISGLNLEVNVSTVFGKISRGRESSSKMREIWVIPLVKSRQLVLPLFIPFASSLQIVLVMQPAANSATSWKSLGDVFPLHTTPSQINDQGIFFRCPLALLFSWRFCWMGRHAALATPSWARVGGCISSTLLYTGCWNRR